jgi:hemerythrin superfamily protein
MPTKDGISGTGIARRPHIRRTWSANPMPSRLQRDGDLARVIAMLTDDHAKVDKLFKRIELLKKRGDDSRYELVVQACEALTVHMSVEEELFYPAARDVLKSDAVKDEDMVDEGEVEHLHIRGLVNELKSLDENDPLCDAKVKVLMDYTRHHVKEEETVLFPAIKKAKPDFDGLYERMVKRREELEQHGMAAAALAAAVLKETTYAPH